MNINVLVLGPVSAGKSTLTNLLFVEQFSDMKIKRTTAVPQVYHETEDLSKISNLKEILLKNRETNTSIMKKTENPKYKLKLDDIKATEYYVPKLFDFLNLRKDVVLTIYDTPGLNDSRTSDVYYQYVKNVFNNLNVVILVLDINSALNTTNETDILTMIITNIKNNKLKYNVDTKMVVLLNKCDDMSLNKVTQKYCLDVELQEMFDQAKNIIDTTVNEIYYGFKYDILPISCEDSYVYRMYQRDPNAKLDEKHLNKFGANEYGKSKWNVMSYEEKQSRVSELFKDFNYDDRITMTGFKQFKSVMQELLNDEYQYNFLLEKLAGKQHCFLQLQLNYLL
jgi:predicted GTPase